MYHTNTAILRKLALKSLKNEWIKEGYMSRDYVGPPDTKNTKVDKDAKEQNNIESS